MLQDVDSLKDYKEKYKTISEENARLVGHQNPKQKINYHLKIKEANNELREVSSKYPNPKLKQHFRTEISDVCAGISKLNIDISENNLNIGDHIRNPHLGYRNFGFSYDDPNIDKLNINPKLLDLKHIRDESVELNSEKHYIKNPQHLHHIYDLDRGFNMEKTRLKVPPTDQFNSSDEFFGVDSNGNLSIMTESVLFTDDTIEDDDETPLIRRKKKRSSSSTPFNESKEGLRAVYHDSSLSTAASMVYPQYTDDSGFQHTAGDISQMLESIGREESELIEQREEVELTPRVLCDSSQWNLHQESGEGGRWNLEQDIEEENSRRSAHEALSPTRSDFLDALSTASSDSSTDMNAATGDVKHASNAAAEMQNNTLDILSDSSVQNAGVTRPDVAFNAANKCNISSNGAAGSDVSSNRAVLTDSTRQDKLSARSLSSSANASADATGSSYGIVSASADGVASEEAAKPMSNASVASHVSRGKVHSAADDSKVSVDASSQGHSESARNSSNTVSSQDPSSAVLDSSDTTSSRLSSEKYHIVEVPSLGSQQLSGISSISKTSSWMPPKHQSGSSLSIIGENEKKQPSSLSSISVSSSRVPAKLSTVDSSLSVVQEEKQPPQQLSSTSSNVELSSHGPPKLSSQGSNLSVTNQSEKKLSRLDSSLSVISQNSKGPNQLFSHESEYSDFKMHPSSCTESEIEQYKQSRPKPRSAKKLNQIYQLSARKRPLSDTSYSPSTSMLGNVSHWSSLGPGDVKSNTMSSVGDVSGMVTTDCSVMHSVEMSSYEEAPVIDIVNVGLGMTEMGSETNSGGVYSLRDIPSISSKKSNEMPQETPLDQMILNKTKVSIVDDNAPKVLKALHNESESTRNSPIGKPLNETTTASENTEKQEKDVTAPSYYADPQKHDFRQRINSTTQSDEYLVKRVLAERKNEEAKPQENRKPEQLNIQKLPLVTPSDAPTSMPTNRLQSTGGQSTGGQSTSSGTSSSAASQVTVINVKDGKILGNAVDRDHMPKTPAPTVCRPVADGMSEYRPNARRKLLHEMTASLDDVDYDYTEDELTVDQGFKAEKHHLTPKAAENVTKDVLDSPYVSIHGTLYERKSRHLRRNDSYLHQHRARLEAIQNDAVASACANADMQAKTALFMNPRSMENYNYSVVDTMDLYPTHNTLDYTKTTIDSTLDTTAATITCGNLVSCQISRRRNSLPERFSMKPFKKKAGKGLKGKTSSQSSLEVDSSSNSSGSSSKSLLQRLRDFGSSKRFKGVRTEKSQSNTPKW